LQLAVYLDENLIFQDIAPTNKRPDMGLWSELTRRLVINELTVP
jgi:hypothetical protein